MKKEKTITLTKSELEKIKRDEYHAGMERALEIFNKQNNLYVAIGKAIEDLILEKAELRKEDY